MKIIDVFKSYTGVMTLSETDKFVAEMANFLSDVTELPANIVLWTKPQPNDLPHNKYRVKVFKDRVHVATYSISQNPKLLWNTNRNKFSLDNNESDEVIKILAEYASLFIQYVDGILTSDEIKQEIKRIKGQ
jgi:hypothetical protein